MDFEEVVREQFGVLDPVQRDICTSLLRMYTELMANSRDRAESLETGYITLFHPDPHANATVTAAYQWTLRGDDGPELIKLKTGRYGSTPDEKAVLLTGKNPADSVIEVMLRAGTADPLEMDDSAREEELRRLFAFWDQTRSASWRPKRHPGAACYTMCGRPARCGQFPPEGKARIYSTTRTIRLSKTSVLDLSFCERQVAWKAVHQIPTDQGEEYEEARETGREFHELCASALLAVDPQATFEELVQGMPDDHQKRLSDLWGRHQAVESAHELPITYKETEYAVGATVVTEGLGVRNREVVPRQPVAVAFIARTDAVGREEDGTPVVVEIRTGESVRDPSRLELDMYALGTSRLVRSDRVAIHHHLLGRASGPECRREIYGLEELAGAAARLEEPAALAAMWDPVDALQPAYSVGAWCTHCDFRCRCENYRDEAPAAF